MSKFIWRGVEDDAVETEIFKRIWEANVPQDASDVKNIDQLQTVPHEMPDGSIRTTTAIVKVSEADILRGNPCFDEVDKPPKEHKKRRFKALNAAEEGGSLLTLE